MQEYITNIQKQTITIQGKTYSPQEIQCIHGQPGLVDFLQEWFNEKKYVIVQTSGSTGTPKQIQVLKEQMMNSAVLTCRFLGLKKGETALLCMSLNYIGAKMMVVRALVSGLDLHIQEASGHPLKNSSISFVFAAMVPLQVYNSLLTETEKEKLKQVRYLIIGGGAISKTLEQEIKNFPNAVYSTYGMTETVSHIALRKLNGPDRSLFYTPFSGVRVSLSPDNTLCIDAPLLLSHPLQTNDLAEINTDGSFRILGRKDNIINTGGLKVSIEMLEELYAPYLSVPFAVTTLPHDKFGESITLLVTGKIEEVSFFTSGKEIPAVYLPKHSFTVEHIPLTENGKIDRSRCKKLAQEQWYKTYPENN